LKLFSSPQQPAVACKRQPMALVESPDKKANSSLAATASWLVTGSAALFLLFFFAGVMAQSDSLTKLGGMPTGDSLPKIKLMAQKDSISKDSGTVRADSLSKNKTIAQKDPLSKNTGIDNKGPTNIVLTDKKIRASGWGEYRVGGHCLCCDNIRDGDCIVVQTTNRTESKRIKQIIDGKTEADTGDKSTYFGDIGERDVPTKPVALLMAEITLPKLQDIYKVIVYTMVDKVKNKSFLSSCELGYTDQFDRLLWAGKVENNEHDDHITFDMEKPIFTKSILLKVKDGRSRITEVAIFTRNK
jgi:hypothetical protein